jgi:hypothetical protein
LTLLFNFKKVVGTNFKIILVLVLGICEFLISRFHLNDLRLEILLRAENLFNSVHSAVKFEIFISQSLNNNIFVTLLVEQLIKLLIQIVPFLRDAVVLLLHLGVDSFPFAGHVLDGLMQPVTLLSIFSQL